MATNNNKKNKNPLYVVTNRGQDVQEAENLIDALIKKLGLEETIKTLEGLLGMMLEMVKSYAFFQVVQQWVDQIVATLEKILKMIDPVLAFSVIKK